MKKIIRLFVILSLLLITNSCEYITTGGSGKFYTGNLVDEIIIIDKSDTTNILIEHFNPRGVIKNSIPYSFVIKDDSSDIIKLNLYVTYGSYSESPNIIKEANYFQDTIFVWYSTMKRNNKHLAKNNSIVAVAYSPKMEYAIIDSIKVVANKDKTININSRHVPI